MVSAFLCLMHLVHHNSTPTTNEHYTNSIPAAIDRFQCKDYSATKLAVKFFVSVQIPTFTSKQQ